MVKGVSNVRFDSEYQLFLNGLQLKRETPVEPSHRPVSARFRAILLREN